MKASLDLSARFFILSDIRRRVCDMRDIEDLLLVVISYEIYETSLMRVS